MSGGPAEISVCSTESESWDTIWKWGWFARDEWWESYRQELTGATRALFALLDERNVKSVLDASCGLGVKTILLAEHGYQVEGADASAVGVRYAPRLAEEHGRRIRFFHSSNEDLGRHSGRTYDCVFSDGFDELPSREILAASARGIYSVLHQGGFFVFGCLPAAMWRSDLQAVIDDEWEKRTPFELLHSCKKGDIRLVQLEVDEKVPEGILEKRIFLIEEEGALRAEIAFMLNRMTWTFGDLEEALESAGFGRIAVERRGTAAFVVAHK
jgi:SAM-dependent methyltransferase